MNNANKALQNYILKTAERVAERNYSSNILVGTIEESFLGGRYSVRLVLQDRELSVSAELLNAVQNFKKNDLVYLLKAPISIGDNFNVKYYIFGLVEKVNEQSEAMIQNSNFSPIVSTLVKKTDQYNFSSDENGLNEKLCGDPITSEKFIKNLQQQGKLLIQGYFSYPEGLRSFDDFDFGLKLKFLSNSQISSEDITSKENIIDTVQWSIKDLILSGQNINHILQNKIIELESNFNRVNAVEVYIYKTGSISSNNLEDFYIKNIQLQVGNYNYSNNNYRVTIAAESEKDYFAYTTEEEEDKVTIAATLLENMQSIENNQIKYYWFLKDDAIVDSNDPSYLKLAGKGWRLLNNILEIETLALHQTNTVKQNKIVAKNNYLSLLSSNPYLNKYKNIIKCIVEIEGIHCESSELIIYNFKYLPDYSFKLISENSQNISTNVLFNETDVLNIKCISQNDDIKSFVNYSYDWIISYKDKDNEDKEYRFSYNQNQIKITYSKDELDFDTVNGIISFPFLQHSSLICKCIITVSQDKQIIEDTAKIEIYSTLSSEEINVSTKYQYGYAVAAKSSLSFERDFNQIDESLPYWLIKDNVNIEQEYQWILREYSNEIEKDDSVLEGYPFEQVYYIYSTKRKIETIEYSDGEKKTYEVLSWTEPTLVRKVQKDAWGKLEDMLSLNEAQQLSTFNLLTNYGKNQGLFYSEGDHGDLYINADYIKTGTIQIGDEEDVKFYASIHNSNVKIAGFEVNYNSILSNNFIKTEDVVYNKNKVYYRKANEGYVVAEDIDDNNFNQIELYELNYIHLGVDKIALGKDKNNQDVFFVTPQGQINATSGSIGGWTIGKDENGVAYLGNDLKDVNGAYFLSQEGKTVKDLNQQEHECYLFFKSKFIVDTDGVLWAEGANINGNISATSGNIGGWTIDGKNLISDMVSLIGTSAEEQGLEDPIRITTEIRGTIYNFLISSIEEIEPVAYVSTDVTDDIMYEGEAALRYREIVEFGFDEFNVPKITFNYSEDGVSTKDEKQYYLYAGQYILNDSLCDKWIQYYQNEDGTWSEMPYAFLTNVIVDASIDSDFYITNSGYLYAKNAKIEGDINAKTGQIGSWLLQDGALISYSSQGLGESGFIGNMENFDISEYISPLVFWAGAESQNDKFEVKNIKNPMTYIRQDGAAKIGPMLIEKNSTSSHSWFSFKLQDSDGKDVVSYSSTAKQLKLNNFSAYLPAKSETISSQTLHWDDDIIFYHYGRELDASRRKGGLGFRSGNESTGLAGMINAEGICWSHYYIWTKEAEMLPNATLEPPEEYGYYRISWYNLYRALKSAQFNSIEYVKF